jgi:molybdopterin-guanine dinucleotide biosynthesis protein A
MPWLSGEMIIRQADDFLRAPSDILAARIEGLYEPLHSVYSKSIQPSLAGYIEGGGSPTIFDFYPYVATRYHDLPVTEETRKALTNINRPEDIIR